jgi:hypothetical protein
MVGCSCCGSLTRLLKLYELRLQSCLSCGYPKGGLFCGGLAPSSKTRDQAETGPEHESPPSSGSYFAAAGVIWMHT